MLGEDIPAQILSFLRGIDVKKGCNGPHFAGTDVSFLKKVYRNEVKENRSQ